MIELLVVIAIIGVLAALILPSLGRARRQARKTVCLNHFRQIAGYLTMYQNEFDDIIPDPVGGNPIRPDLWCGTEQERLEEAKNRPLNHYVTNYEVFTCPEDKGIDFEPHGLSHLPTQYDAKGNSYVSNRRPWMNTRHENLGPATGRRLGWVPRPSKFILLVEPPALPVIWLAKPPCEQQPGGGGCPAIYYQRWHMANRPFTQEPNAVDGQPFLSPVLFVDGHAAFHDFRNSLLDDSTYPAEETRDWMWYKAGPGPGEAPCP